MVTGYYVWCEMQCSEEQGKGGDLPTRSRAAASGAGSNVLSRAGSRRRNKTRLHKDSMLAKRTELKKVNDETKEILIV